jgi:uncharacterized protein YuzE
MAKVMVYYHKENDTLDVWFGDPQDEFICEEVGEGVILKKNKAGKVIGFEKLYVTKTVGTSSLPVELVVV